MKNSVLKFMKKRLQFSKWSKAFEQINGLYLKTQLKHKKADFKNRLYTLKWMLPNKGSGLK